MSMYVFGKTDNRKKEDVGSHWRGKLLDLQPWRGLPSKPDLNESGMAKTALTMLNLKWLNEVVIDELMHPHLPTPPRYQNWMIEEEEALHRTEKAKEVGQKELTHSSPQLECLHNLPILSHDSGPLQDMRGKGATYARSWLKVAQEGAQTAASLCGNPGRHKRRYKNEFTAKAGEDLSYVLTGPEVDWNFLSAFMCYVFLIGRLNRGIAPVAIIDRQLPFEYTIASRSTDVMVMVLRVERKLFGIEQHISPALPTDSKYLRSGMRFMMLRMRLLELKFMFEKQTKVERFDLIQTFHVCKQEEGKLVDPYVIKMKNYVAQLERLGYVLPQDISVGLIMNGLTSDFAGFVRNYNKHNMRKTISELHALLIEYEKGLL
ncbi:hypothetical protein Tco_0730635 [Tanacetum coccineum]|uniref:Uncharacterized protein n=1 Tax=Tanacetum coccineum TaxID=301880 RepID=A0ABQ4YSB6_9ASTR